MSLAHAGRSCSKDGLSDRISKISPGLSLSSARVIRTRRPSAADRLSASMLVEELKIIHGLEENTVAVHLRANPSLQAFHVQDLPVRWIVVIHLQQRIGPARKPRLVFFGSHGEVAVAVSGRGPDRAHFGAVHQVLGERSRPVLVADSAGVDVAFGAGV